MDNNKSFVPTVEWMAQKYQEMNEKLFGGELGYCDFNIFTTGRGSQGRVLGWFKLAARGIRVYANRRMYKTIGWNEERINEYNFVNFCRPTIEINGNYRGTEYGFLATLVHEMCHYYTYMYGYCPRQAHGPEFRQIGAIVSRRSKGLFTIQRIATAEEMSQLELNDEMKAKREKRLKNKKASVSAVIVFTQDGKVKLTITSSEKLIDLITTTERDERNEKVVTTNDSSVIDYLFSKGYQKNMRTWRYWNIEDKPWIDELKNMLPETSGQTLGTKRPQPQVKKQPRYVFSINTSTGKFECEVTAYSTLFKAIKERFPKMSDETIERVMNNKANYKLEENKMNTTKIIKEVLDELINNQSDDAIEITPNMNLGQVSPLEMQ